MDHSHARQRLEQLAAELQERINQLDGSVHHRAQPLAADFAEQATEQENLEVMQALDREGREELHLIRAALARIESGEYGTCQQCGNAIDAMRLEAVPFAACCISCAD